VDKKGIWEKSAHQLFKKFPSRKRHKLPTILRYISTHLVHETTTITKMYAEKRTRIFFTV